MALQTYIHEHGDWPRLHWDEPGLAQPLAAVVRKQGRLTGRLEALGFELRQEAALRTLTEDVVKSSAIEGEHLDAEQVRSSIARRLGIETSGLEPADRRVEGVVEMMLDATGRYDQPLSAERLFAWHSSLFPAGRSGMRRIRVGAWREASDGPMQVVSGAVGRERVHYEAPSADRLEGEMAAFLEWFNAPPTHDQVMQAGLAHLWFVTIHPLDDGNGRVARALADMLLARSEQSSQRFYSMSAQIRRERADYYEILERTQKGTSDVTLWMQWFAGCLDRAIDGADELIGTVLAKARFWDGLRGEALNERQRTILNRLLDGFEGKLTTSKWAKLAKCSQDTALRDIAELVDRRILTRSEEGGRSTSYSLADIHRL